MKPKFFYCVVLAVAFHGILLFGIAIPAKRHLGEKKPERPHVEVSLVQPQAEEPPPAPPPPPPEPEPEPEPPQETPPPIEPVAVEPVVVPEAPQETIKALTVQEPVVAAEAEFQVAATTNVVVTPPTNIPLSPPVATIVPASIVVKAEAKYRHNPPPDYPLQAKRRRQEGVVLLRVLLDTAGAPTKVEIKESSGYPILDTAARDAVGRWKFEPTTLDGNAVMSEVEVPVRFKMLR